MKLRVATILSVALLCLLMIPSAADNNAVIQSDCSNFENLHQLAISNSNVRVLVKLNVPGIKNLTEESNRFSTVAPGREHQWGGDLADMELKQAISQVADAVLFSLNGTQYDLNHTFSSIPYLALRVSPEALATLQSLPEVLEITEDKPVKLPLPTKGDMEQRAKDGTTVPSPPNLYNTVGIIGAENSWQGGYTGSGWYVAILDTGIRSSHEFFTGKTIVEACYALGDDGTAGTGDCPNGLSTQTGSGSATHHPNTYQGWDHGTHVSGIATGNNGSLYGVAKDANIIAVQVFSKFSASDCGGSACVMSWSSDSAAGLDYVYSIRGSYSIASANMSLGGGAYNSACDSDSRKAAIDNLRVVGIATAIASGNNGYCGYIGSPACISSSVAVGGSTDDDAEAYFNNWHPTMQQLFAPGVFINSSTGDSDSSYESWNGTSMATPHVAGTWALLKHAYPTKGVTDLLGALRDTGVGVTSVCDGYTTPIPRIQIDEAIASLSSLTLTSPNGGELLVMGSTHNITWTTTGAFLKRVYILLRQSDINVALIAKNLNPSAGNYAWTVGDCVKGFVPTGSNLKILVTQKGYPVEDLSNADFTITEPSITITSPNGGEEWVMGSTQNITWDQVGLSSTDNLFIIVWQDGVSAALIQKGLDPTTGSYPWTVGDCRIGSVSTGVGYKILLFIKDSKIKDKSDGKFILTN